MHLASVMGTVPVTLARKSELDLYQIALASALLSSSVPLVTLLAHGCHLVALFDRITDLL